MKLISTKFVGTLCLFILAGCSSIISSTTSNMADNLRASILNQDDLKTVEHGAPAYLLLLDSMVDSSPDNSQYLISSAKLYNAYTSVFVNDEKRAKRLSTKSFTYAKRAACLQIEELCHINDLTYKQLIPLMIKINPSNSATFYTVAVSWGSWIEKHRSNWNAIADIPKVKLLLTKLLELDDTMEGGNVHLYMGILESLIPPAAGGNLEKAKMHFEKADKLSNGKNLMVKVLYASEYARMIFDRKLHDKLLNEVITTDIHHKGLVLTNTVAKEQAKELLGSADDYF